MVLAGSGAAANRPDLAASLGTVAKAHNYLRAIGVDPRSVVIQRGKRNYAGPHCPGKRWNCTKATRVLQIAQATSQNWFVCDPASAGTDHTTNSCVIVQVASGGTNQAACSEGSISMHVPNETQSCSITQTNTTGANSFFVHQDLSQDDAQANGSQQVAVTQQNGSGSNTASIEQDLEQSSDVTADTVTQVQEARQHVDLDQISDTGANSSTVKQVLSLHAGAQAAGAVSQSQNTADSGPNTFAAVKQTSNSGTNSSSLNQSHRLDAQATSGHGPVTQSQGSSSGGLRGEVHQQSSGQSTSTSNQNEDQIAHATTPPGTLTQNQTGPLYCCGVGSSTGNGANSVTVNQTGRQESDGGNQVDIAEAACRSSGTCATSQSKTNNVDSLTIGDGCSGSVESPCVVDRIVECTSEGCSTFPADTGSPDSVVQKAVRNVSNEESTFAPSTFANTEDTVEYQIAYHNAGTGTANAVTLTDTPPADIAFTSCTGGCVVGEGGTLTWNLGDVPAGEGRTVTFRGVYAGNCSTASNTATADSAQEDPVTSNPADVTETCIG